MGCGTSVAPEPPEEPPPCAIPEPRPEPPPRQPETSRGHALARLFREYGTPGTREHARTMARFGRTVVFFQEKNGPIPSKWPTI